MTTEIRFFGYSAFEITNSQGVKILIDPYLDENPVSPVKVDDLDKADLILVNMGLTIILAIQLKSLRSLKPMLYVEGMYATS